MRLVPAILSCIFLCAASAASADSRVFIISNQADDGYGVDQCLARGDKCGAHAAHSYCQSRDFVEATAYRRIDPDEVAGSVPIRAKTAAVPGAKNSSPLPASAETSIPSLPNSAPLGARKQRAASGTRGRRKPHNCLFFEVHDISQHLVMRT